MKRFPEDAIATPAVGDRQNASFILVFKNSYLLADGIAIAQMLKVSGNASSPSVVQINS